MLNEIVDTVWTVDESDGYLVVRAQLSERVQTLLQLCRHAARQLPALGDLPAEGAVVLHQAQDVAAVAVGPHPMAGHQSRGGAGEALAGAAADGARGRGVRLGVTGSLLFYKRAALSASVKAQLERTLD